MSDSTLSLPVQSRPALVLRLSDPAATLAYVSFIFGLLLVVFPVSFPRIIVHNWQNARLTPIMILFTVSLNLGLYLSVAHQRSSKPGILAAACLGSVPVFLLAGLNFLLQATIAHTLSGNMPNALARGDEEIIAHHPPPPPPPPLRPFLLIPLR